MPQTTLPTHIQVRGAHVKNLKNIDILFYDELLERSRYIVRSAEVIEDKLLSAL